MSFVLPRVGGGKHVDIVEVSISHRFHTCVQTVAPPEIQTLNQPSFYLGIYLDVKHSPVPFRAAAPYAESN